MPACVCACAGVGLLVRKKQHSTRCFAHSAGRLIALTHRKLPIASWGLLQSLSRLSRDRLTLGACTTERVAGWDLRGEVGCACMKRLADAGADVLVTLAVREIGREGGC